MNDQNNEITIARPPGLVPLEYAEKAMGSLMSLHNALMEEKERRVDLYRRLMEKEQAVAELRMYVKLLEEKLARPVAAPAPAPAPETAPARRPEPPPPPRAVRVVSARPPPQDPIPITRAAPRPAPPPTAMPPRAQAAAANEGWKTW